MSGEEISVVTEESFAVGEVAIWGYVVVNMAGKRNISYYTAEVMNNFKWI